MKQLPDEIRLQIFQQNIGCEVQYKDRIEDVIGVVEHNVYLTTNKVYHENSVSFHFLTLIKRPSSSITDEEAKEVARIITGRPDGIVANVRKGEYWEYITFKGISNLEVRIALQSASISCCNVYGNSVALIDINPLQAYQYLHNRLKNKINILYFNPLP